MMELLSEVQRHESNTPGKGRMNLGCCSITAASRWLPTRRLGFEHRPAGLSMMPMLKPTAQLSAQRRARYCKANFQSYLHPLFKRVVRVSMSRPLISQGSQGCARQPGQTWLRADVAHIIQDTAVFLYHHVQMTKLSPTFTWFLLQNRLPAALAAP